MLDFYFHPQDCRELSAKSSLCTRKQKKVTAGRSKPWPHPGFSSCIPCMAPWPLSAPCCATPCRSTCTSRTTGRASSGAFPTASGAVRLVVGWTGETSRLVSGWDGVVPSVGWTSVDFLGDGVPRRVWLGWGGLRGWRRIYPATQGCPQAKLGPPVIFTLPETIMEVEHRPLEDHFPLQRGPGQLP